MKAKNILAPGIALCAGLMLSLAGVANAQIFQSVFPGGFGAYAARGGVVHTRDGGSISVGEAQSFLTAQGYDLYVVKTDRCGIIEWAATYDLGGDDFGRKIRQTRDGGYVIVGSTNNLNSCCTAPSQADPVVRPSDIVLLKLREDGVTEWAKTYGGLRNDEGTDVELYGSIGFIVSGHTESFGMGGVSAYLMRTDASGNVIWSRTYGQSSERFNACAVMADGNIVAAGVSNSITRSTSMFLARVSATDGGTLWANIYPARGAVVARSVIEFLEDQIVVAGYIALTEHGSQRDGYLARLDGAGNMLIDRAYTPKSVQDDDEFAEVRQTAGGGLVVTGYLTNPIGGFGGRDLYLSEVNAKLGLTWHTIHGGARNDEGYSVAPSTNPDSKPTYTASGVTANFTKGDEELYLIRARSGGLTGCYDSTTTMEVYSPGLQNIYFSFCSPHAYAQCIATMPASFNMQQRLLCSTCLQNPDEEEMPQLPRDLNLGQVHGEKPELHSANVSFSKQ